MSDTSNITIGLNEIDNKLDLNSSKDNQNSSMYIIDFRFQI